MKKKIFITGASGFVGSHLVEAANAMGLEVHAAIRSSSNTKEIEPFVDKFVFPDFNNADKIAELFDQEKYNYIIHAAALTKAKSESIIKDVNVGYTDHLLQAAFKADIPLERFVYVSSLAAIGPIAYNTDSLIQDTSPYNPLTIYGRSKKESELMILDKFNDKNISIFRPTAVYGPREKDIFILFDTLNKGFDPYIGNKPQKLSFIYVKDLVDVLLLGASVPQNGLQFYNISDGNVYSRYDMADIFKEFFNKNLFRMHIPYGIVKLIAQISQGLYRNSSKTPVIYPERLFELTAENWAVDINHAKAALGFNPKYDLKNGLSESLKWYKDNKWL